MKYSVVTAPIHFVKEPTCSLRNPVETLVYYTEYATILDFNTEQEAIDHVQSFLPFDKVMALPGRRDALQLYSDLWMGKDNQCMQNLENLASNLEHSEMFNWDYGQDDLAMLTQSIEECDDMHDDAEDGNAAETSDGKLVVGGYLMGDSALLGGRCSFMLMMTCPLEFETLPRDQQELVIVPETINKKKVTVDSGRMFDMWCIKECDGSPHFAKFFAWRLYVADLVRSKSYSITSRITEAWYTEVIKINKFRLKKGWI